MEQPGFIDFYLFIYFNTKSPICVMLCAVLFMSPMFSPHYLFHVACSNYDKRPNSEQIHKSNYFKPCGVGLTDGRSRRGISSSGLLSSFWCCKTLELSHGADCWPLGAAGLPLMLNHR